MNRTPVAVALGSNLGDRSRTLDAAVEHLRRFLTDVQVSSYHDTAPVGVEPQPRFLNAAAVGHATSTAAELLAELLRIETLYGRQRPGPGAPRTLDLDLILFGDAVMREDGLEVPHPRFRERAFVLAPLSEIAPNWRDPVSGMTVLELLSRLGR